MKLKLLSPVGSKPVTFTWPDNLPSHEHRKSQRNIALEIIFTIKWICEDFPELKLPLNNNILVDYDITSYESMRSLCERYNKLIKLVVTLNKGTTIPTQRLNEYPSKEFLRHIMQQTYNYAVMHYQTVLVEVKSKEENTLIGSSGLLLNKKYVLITSNLLLPIIDGKTRELLFNNFECGKLYTTNFPNNSFLFNIVQKNNNNDYFHVSHAKVFGFFFTINIKTSTKNLLKDWTIDSVDNKNDLNEILSLFFVLTTDSLASISEFKQVLTEWWSLVIDLDIKKSDEIFTTSVPFGNRNFIDNHSRGIVSNILGNNSCLILSDCPCTPGSEGGGVYKLNSATKVPFGIVLSCLSWWRGDWIGLTLIADIRPILLELLNIHFNINNDISESQPHYRLLANSNRCIVQIYSGPNWGTAVLLNKTKGIFITNSHVLDSGGNVVNIHWLGNRMSGKVVYKTPNDGVYDLGIVLCDPVELKNLPLRSIMVCKKYMNIGDTVYCGGFSLFSKDTKTHATLTKGCISNYSPYMIKTTCCIHPGASGGAIMNPHGDLIGIIVCNTKLESNGVVYPRVNTGIPVSVFSDIVEQYISTGDDRILGKLNTEDVEAVLAWKRLEGKL